MWPFKKKPEPPAGYGEKNLEYSTTELQVGDNCVCIGDRPHKFTHQKLLTLGATYKVRDVTLGDNGEGYGGPYIALEGIFPASNGVWACERFKKALKLRAPGIVEKVKEPIVEDFDVKKERELADEMWGRS